MANKNSSNHKNPHFVKREAINFGYKVAKANIFYFVTIFVVLIFANIFFSIVQNLIAGQNQLLLSFVVTVAKTIFGLVTGMGLIKIALMLVDKKKPQVSNILYTKSLVNYFLVSLVSGAIILAGFILFIIPGIIFSIKLQFSTYLVVDKNMGVVDALKKSWNMTKGVKMNLFLLELLLLGINILGIMALIVGLIITVPLAMVAQAFVYRKLLAQVS